jgi:hypothetical protein
MKLRKSKKKPADDDLMMQMQKILTDIIPIVDVPPPIQHQADLHLGTPLYHTEIAWQEILRGMQDGNTMIRVHTDSDRSSLYKTAGRMGIKLQTTKSSEVSKTTWVARVVGDNPIDSAAADLATSAIQSGGFGRNGRGRYRALAVLVLVRGSAQLTSKHDAARTHVSLRKFIWQQKLTGWRDMDAAKIKDIPAEVDKPAAWEVSVSPQVSARFREKVALAEAEKKAKRKAHTGAKSRKD